MTSWQITRIFAGSFVLISLLLGVPGSPLFVSQWWLALTAFVGLNLLQSGFTRFCPLELLLRRLGLRQGA
jgi:hypothetical protein